MKIIRAGFASAAAAASAFVLFTPPIAAEPTPCPDGMVPMDASLVPRGDQKDKNNNGLVCIKYEDSNVHGGPDDNNVVDDIVL
jgi:hypothetical protein